MSKVWVSRTKDSVELWSKAPEKRRSGFYSPDTFIYRLCLSTFEKYFSFTPRENSCTEYNLSDLVGLEEMLKDIPINFYSAENF